MVAVVVVTVVVEALNIKRKPEGANGKKKRATTIYSVTPKRRKTLTKKTQPTPQCVGQGRIFRKAKQRRPVKTHVQRGQDTR